MQIIELQVAVSVPAMHFPHILVYLNPLSAFTHIHGETHAHTVFVLGRWSNANGDASLSNVSHMAALHAHIWRRKAVNRGSKVMMSHSALVYWAACGKDLPSIPAMHSWHIQQVHTIISASLQILSITAGYRNAFKVKADYWAAGGRALLCPTCILGTFNRCTP